MIIFLAVQVKVESLKYQALGQVADNHGIRIATQLMRFLRCLKQIYFGADPAPWIIPINCTTG